MTSRVSCIRHSPIGHVTHVAMVVAVALLASLPAVVQAGFAPASVEAEIRALTANPPARLAGESLQWQELRRVYDGRNDEPLWPAGPEADQQVVEVERRLAAAAAHGIGSGDLHLAALAGMQHPGDARAAAERDLLLTDAVLRYATKLRRGSAPDDAYGRDWNIEPDAFAPADGLLQAARDRAVPAWLDSLAPTDGRYRRLQEALGRYREIAAFGGWPILAGGDELKLGSQDPRLAILRERLRIEGDLPAADNSPSALSDALKRFQARHGLEPDGRIGAGTRAALAPSAEDRVAQILVNLERWRHLPRRSDRTYVEVNVAGATLTLVEDNAPAMAMRVIVGDLRHHTPVVAANITAVTLNPVWNVPRSITTKEMLPRLRRDPAYLANNEIAIVDLPDDPYGQSFDWKTISASSFPYRLRQRPGAKNSLGRIKLEMPNPDDVYLHDTPSKRLFQRAQRNFSHGCVRVEQVASLAIRLLQRPEWDQAAIDRAVAEGDTQRLPLERAVPVYLLYWTAFVDDEGQVQFRTDVYGRDAPILRTLGADQPKPPATAEISTPKG